MFWHENPIPQYDYHQKHLISVSYRQRAGLEELQERAQSQGSLIVCLKKYCILSLLPLQWSRYHKRAWLRGLGYTPGTRILGRFAAIFCASLNKNNDKIITVIYWEHTVSKHCAKSFKWSWNSPVYEVSSCIILILYVESELREFENF